MAGVRSLRRTRAVAMVSALLLVLTACSDQSPSTLRPAGPGARRLEGFWWILFWISLAVCVIVVAGVIVVLVRRRRAGNVSQRDEATLVLVAGAVVPFLVLATMYGLSLRDTLALSRPSDGSQLTLEVIAHQWWWEVRYPPGADVVTANEIHIPTNTDVELRLNTADVLHSFWVPQLMPKTDVIAGRTNTTWIRADEAGSYRGQCAEYCGLQHAHMAFMVVAHPQAEFDEWLREAGGPAPSPDTAAERRGLEIFTQTTCASCHTVRGTPAIGTVGPDLTSVGSRWSLGAGTVANDAEHMRQWIADSQQVKPGNAMPPQPVSATDMDDLIAYLRSLTPPQRGPS